LAREGSWRTSWHLAKCMSGQWLLIAGQSLAAVKEPCAKVGDVASRVRFLTGPIAHGWRLITSADCGIRNAEQMVRASAFKVQSP